MVMKPASSPTDLNVRWQTVYDLLDADGAALLRETQIWTMRDQDDSYVLELEWSGFAFTGGHAHDNWGHDDFRTVMQNAIIWTANLEIPEGGVPSETPTREKLNANQDKPKPEEE